MNRPTNQPCAVILHMRDGTVSEQVYPTRFQAELFLYLLPLLMMTQPDGDQVASATISPLVEEAALDTATTGGRRFDHWLQ